MHKNLFVLINLFYRGASRNVLKYVLDLDCKDWAKKPLTCTSCQKDFKTPTTLSRHITRMHGGIEPTVTPREPAGDIDGRSILTSNHFFWLVRNTNPPSLWVMYSFKSIFLHVTNWINDFVQVVLIFQNSGSITTLLCYLQLFSLQIITTLCKKEMATEKNCAWSSCTCISEKLDRQGKHQVWLGEVK